MVQSQRAFSSTGKAILAGGYLVLFPEYKAYVVALSSRMHALTNVTDLKNQIGIVKITVDSPQFVNGSWSYEIDVSEIENQGLSFQLKEINGRRNPFVEATIVTVLSYAIGVDSINSRYVGKNIEIKIFSDAEYHSKDESEEKSSANGAYKFLYHSKEITEVNKTGLGSSAGLVTSLTAAILSTLFSSFTINNEWKSKVHNIAQVAHCKAQGKIGSGFDVASATFGSIVYQRFEASLINKVFESSIADLVHLIDKENWNMVNDQCSLPKGIRLLMGDVKGGSETPKMVSKVMEWKNKNPERASEVWTKLNNSNMKLIDSLQKLDEFSQRESDKYDQLTKYVSKMNASEIALLTKENLYFAQIAQSIQCIRECLQIMTEETGASIEPESQTKLIDSVSVITGVLGDVVPGAGGYDAICMLVFASEVENIIKETSKSDNPILGNVRWMDLTEQRDGLIEENYSDFNGF